MYNYIIMTGVFGNNEVESHLEMGKKLIQEGKMADALEHYNMAVCTLHFNNVH